jgi:hypothetical protein
MQQRVVQTVAISNQDFLIAIVRKVNLPSPDISAINFSAVHFTTGGILF